MFYKAIKNREVVDVMGSLDCVKYSKLAKMAVRCGVDELPGGIITSDGSTVYHVNGWAPLKGYETVTLVEIGEDEYMYLRDLLSFDEAVVEDPEPQEEPQEEVPYAAETLEWAKSRKVLLSKKMLAEYLQNNPLQSAAHGGVMGTYSVTEEKQNLMLLNYSTYQIQKNAGINAVITWNQTGEECEEWTEAEFLQLILEAQRYVKPLVSKQQSLEKQIMGASTLMEVNSIEIAY